LLLVRIEAVFERKLHVDLYIGRFQSFTAATNYFMWASAAQFIPALKGGVFLRPNDKQFTALDFESLWNLDALLVFAAMKLRKLSSLLEDVRMGAV